MTHIRVSVAGRELPQEFIDAWELRRAQAAARFLNAKLGVPGPRRVLDAGPGELVALRAVLTDAKRDLDPERVRAQLAPQLRLSDLSAKAMGLASLGRRKASVVDIVCEGASAAEATTRMMDLFTASSPRNHALALMGSPDHYVMAAHEGSVQEIVEFTGGAPMPSQFFITWGDTAAVAFPRDLSFDLEMAGTARLKDGTIVGSVRHQYRDEGSAFRARLADEFPAIFPPSLITAHQLHLACEFVIWYRALVTESALVR